MDFASSFATSVLSVRIMPSIFRAGGDMDVLFPAILRTLSHTHAKGVPELIKETYCLHDVRLASFSTRLALALVFLY